MSLQGEAEAGNWPDALLAAALHATGGRSIGGTWIRSQPDPVWDAWLCALVALLPEAEAPLRLPANTTREHLCGDLDLAATLAVGQTRMRRGILDADPDRQLLLAGAEPWTPSSVAQLIEACEGVGALRSSDRRRLPCLVVRDEGLDDEITSPALLLDRLGFRVDLSGVRCEELKLPASWTSQRVAEARAQMAHVFVPETVISSIVTIATALGVTSSRADTFAIAVARAHAAWRSASCVDELDAAIAIRLVMVPRATRVPDLSETSNSEPSVSDEEPAAPAGDHSASGDASTSDAAGAIEDQHVEPVAATLPLDILKTLKTNIHRSATINFATGRSNGRTRKARRGRPIGHTAGDPRRNGPLHLLATIVRAAPWQGLRRQWRRRSHSAGQDARRLIVMPSDLRVKRFKHHASSTIVFVVDASGSSALHRMGEAKGAIELLLKECYVRRDKVALVAFQGSRAETLLSPTRALARARRALSGLPGGGATPLASGLVEAREIALSSRRAGQDCLIVLLTDGRANIDLSGSADRRKATADALDVGRALAAQSIPAVVVDTSSAPNAKAADLAHAMRARYAPLPNADAYHIAAVVRQSYRNRPTVSA